MISILIWTILRKVAIKYEQSFIGIHLLPNALSYIIVKMIVKFELFKACQPPPPPQQKIKYCRPTIESKQHPSTQIDISWQPPREGCPSQLLCVCNNASRLLTASERFKLSISCTFFSYIFRIFLFFLSNFT